MAFGPPNVAASACPPSPEYPNSDVSPASGRDPTADFVTIRDELARFPGEPAGDEGAAVPLADRPQLAAANKIDIAGDRSASVIPMDAATMAETIMKGSSTLRRSARLSAGPGASRL